jgi:hypothetical protein
MWRGKAEELAAKGDVDVHETLARVTFSRSGEAGAERRMRAPGLYPDRIVPKSAQAAVKLKECTLTNLHNLRPRWLADAHDALGRAVAAAYGWAEDLASDDALARLLALNLERAKSQ